MISPTVTAVLAQKTLDAFCVVTDPGYIRSPHGALLIERLEALERRDITGLIVELPPRHGKSFLSAQRFPAWYLGRRPSEHVIVCSYAAELAEQHSRIIRALVQSLFWPFKMRLAQGSQAVHRWDTTAGGGLLAEGVLGGITGFGADLLVIDDAIKDRREADSAFMRDLQWGWYQDVARTRLHPRGVQLISGSRWHEDDLVGRLLNSEGQGDWEVLRLPALAEAGDPLGRPAGEALWPARFPLEALPSVAKGQISPRSWAALYQQRPAPEEGALFKRDRVRRWTRLPIAAEPPVKPPPWTVVETVDGAWGLGVSADRSAVAVWGSDGKDYYLLDAWAGRVDYPDLRRIVTERWRAQAQLPSAVLIEDAANGRALIQDLRRTLNLPTVAVPPVGSKIARAEAVTGVWEGGRVYIPDAPWADDWLEEHLVFPQGAHDDYVDTTSLALGFLMARNATSTLHSLRLSLETGQVADDRRRPFFTRFGAKMAVPTQGPARGG